MSTAPIIPGTTTGFDTTGYPNPNPPTQGPPSSGSLVNPTSTAIRLHLDIPPSSTGDPTGRSSDHVNRQILPSNPMIQFSIGDLQHLGKVNDIGQLEFIVAFIRPEQARLPVVTIQIALPEGEVVYETRFLNESARPEYMFALSPREAEIAQRHFVLGNRIRLMAVSEVEIDQGELKIAVRR
ncbi:MAG TPA: hypothetical protein VFK06_15135 [Candidatus Angelobacter sp.]|nr:hypothetical protein [Candidatus Angelobacter sp.]